MVACTASMSASSRKLAALLAPFADWIARNRRSIARCCALKRSSASRSSAVDTGASPSPVFARLSIGSPPQANVDTPVEPRRPGDGRAAPASWYVDASQRSRCPRDDLADRIPRPCRDFLAECLLDQDHEGGPFRARDVCREDRATLHAQDPRPVDLDRQRKPRPRRVPQEGHDTLRARRQSERCLLYTSDAADERSS